MKTLWWRLRPMQRAGVMAATIVLLVLPTVLGIRLLDSAIMRSESAADQPATPPSAQSSAQTPSPTPSAPPQAIQASRVFTTAYLGYSWDHPSDPRDLRGYTTDRLFNSLLFEGATPDGRRAPWTAVRPDLHEQDTVDILGMSSQATGNGQASVQLVIMEHSRTDLGRSDTRKEIDLALEQRTEGVWLVDWVTEGQAS